MKPKSWRSAWVVAVLFQTGCFGGAVGDAVLNTGIALGSSAISRSQGGCYASCPTGTTCNKGTGYCDPIPCRGTCDPFQECVEDGLFYRCVARNPAKGNIILQPAQKPSEQTPAEPQR
jgi:hypothetical protein